MWMKTASMTKKVAIIVYQSSGMLKARPARAAADQAMPTIAAPHTNNTAIGDRGDGDEALASPRASA